MGKIYDYMRKEKWPLILCSTLVLGAGATIDGVYEGIINPPKPKDYAVARYLKIESRLDNQRVCLRDLLNPVFRDSLETTLQELETERNSLRVSPNFENNMKIYKDELEKASENSGSKMIGGGILMMFSLIGIGEIGTKSAIGSKRPI